MRQLSWLVLLCACRSQQAAPAPAPSASESVAPVASVVAPSASASASAAVSVDGGADSEERERRARQLKALGALKPIAPLDAEDEKRKAELRKEVDEMAELLTQEGASHIGERDGGRAAGAGGGELRIAPVAPRTTTP